MSAGLKWVHFRRKKIRSCDYISYVTVMTDQSRKNNKIKYRPLKCLEREILSLENQKKIPFFTQKVKKNAYILVLKI